MITEGELYLGGKMENGKWRALTAAEIKWANAHYYPRPAPGPVKPVTPPLKKTLSQAIGVKKNTKTKKKKSGDLKIARSANVIPLRQGAVGYQGLRIS